MPVTHGGVNRQNPYAGVVSVTGPTDISLLVDFLNTVDEEQGTDDLADDRTTATWFREHGLDVPTTDAARRVRTALRTAADGRADPAGKTLGVPLEVTVQADGTPLLTSSDPLGPIVAAAARLAIDGRWRRIKLCVMDTCRYAFYDESRNQSGRWCSMAVCGNRAKTRAFRARQR